MRVYSSWAMRIVIDTTTIVRDYRLEGSLFEVLAEGMDRAGHTLFVPNVVVDESIRRFAEDSASEVRALNKQVRRSRRVLSQLAPQEIDDEQVKTLRDEYNLFIRKALEELGTTFLPYPQVDHESIVQRELSGRKPFSSGKGYRDFLIWKTVLELAAQDEERVIFVSENTADFANEQNDGFHDHLLADLDSAGLSRDQVMLSTGLQDFVERFLKPSLDKLQGLEAEVMSGKFRGTNLKEAIGLLIQEKTAGDEWNPADLGFDDRLTSPTLDMVEDVHEIDVLDVRGLEGDRALIEVEALCGCVFDVYVEKGDLWVLEDEDLGIWDYDWNEWVAAGNKRGDVKASITFIVDLNSGEIESSEMTDIEGVQPW